MRFSLLAAYPDSFGGMYQDASGGMTVVEVGANPSFESAARSRFSTALASYGVATSAAPALAFVRGTHNFKQILGVRDAIAADWAQVEPTGIFAVGLNDQAGRVVLTETGSPSASAEVSALESEYGAGLFSVSVEPPLKGDDATRYADAAPWNGGDEIVHPTNDPNKPEFCSSGFGLHDVTTGTEYLLSAGHCDESTWWNTQHQAPVYGSSNDIGSTVSGTKIVSGADLQLISPIGGSSCISWGDTSTDPNHVVRYYITGYANPPMSAKVLQEGALGFEHQETVTSYDTTASYSTTYDGEVTVQGADLTNYGATNGDSGGPIVYPSIYGYLAGGVILASDAAGSGHITAFQLIDVPIYIYSGQFGHSITVNTSPDGTHC
jgi:hypothetical protein